MTNGSNPILCHNVRKIFAANLCRATAPRISRASLADHYLQPVDGGRVQQLLSLCKGYARVFKRVLEKQGVGSANPSKASNLHNLYIVLVLESATGRVCPALLVLDDRLGASQRPLRATSKEVPTLRLLPLGHIEHSCVGKCCGGK